jgi:hypothetical protein
MKKLIILGALVGLLFAIQPADLPAKGDWAVELCKDLQANFPFF